MTKIKILTKWLILAHARQPLSQQSERYWDARWIYIINVIYLSIFKKHNVYNKWRIVYSETEERLELNTVKTR